MTSGDNDAGAGADAVAVTMRLHVLGISAAQSAVTVAAELRDGSGARTERAVVGFGARRASHAQSQSPRGGFGSPPHTPVSADAAGAPARVRVLLSASTSLSCLAHAEEDVGVGETRFKQSPPIRHALHRQGLWRALLTPGLLTPLSGGSDGGGGGGGGDGDGHGDSCGGGGGGGAHQSVAAPAASALPRTSARDDGMGACVGGIHLVCSAHSPVRSDAKMAGDFMRAASGIACAQLLLPVLWTRLLAHGNDAHADSDIAAAASACRAGAHPPPPPTPRAAAAAAAAAVRARGDEADAEAAAASAFDATRAAERALLAACLPAWVCARPAALLGLRGRKGAITVGADADFVVWDADATFRVPSPAAEKTAEWRGDAPAPTTAAALPPLATLHGALADGSTFEGATLRGVVRATYVRGRCVYAAAAPPPLASGAPEAIVGRFRSRPIGEAIGAPEWSERILETRPVVVQVDSSSCYDST